MTYAKNRERIDEAEQAIAELAETNDARTLSRMQRALEIAYRRVKDLPADATPEEAAALAGIPVLVLAGLLPGAKELAGLLDQASGRALMALTRRRRADVQRDELTVAPPVPAAPPEWGRLRQRALDG